MAQLADRINAITESATLAIDAKAKALSAQGKEIISFGAGEPDFPTPDHIVAAAIKAAADPRNHHYSATAGLPGLRQAVAAKTTRDSGWAVEPNQVLITNGAKQAIYNALAAVINPDDEVLLAAPYWVTYPECIRLAGGVPVCVPSDETTNFHAPLDGFKQALTPRTKAVLFVSPSNPTGAVYTKTEITELGRWAAARDLWVITDEIYEPFIFGKSRFYSLPALVPETASRCIVVSGVSKTYAMTGWRVGWMIGPVNVIQAATNLQSHSTSNVANVSQQAALAALEGDQGTVHAMREAFDRRRQLIFQLLRQIPGVVCPEPEGAFYVFPSFKAFVGRKIGGRLIHNTIELAELLLEQAEVAVVPGEAFGAPGYIRLSYALSDQDLTEGIRRIKHVLTGGQIEG